MSPTAELQAVREHLTRSPADAATPLPELARRVRRERDYADVRATLAWRRVVRLELGVDLRTVATVMLAGGMAVGLLLGAALMFFGMGGCP